MLCYVLDSVACGDSSLLNLQLSEKLFNGTRVEIPERSMGLRVREGSDFHHGSRKTKVSWRADATADNFFKSAKLPSIGCKRDDNNLEMSDPH